MVQTAYTMVLEKDCSLRVSPPSSPRECSGNFPTWSRPSVDRSPAMGGELRAYPATLAAPALKRAVEALDEALFIERLAQVTHCSGFEHPQLGSVIRERRDEENRRRATTVG